MSEDIVTERTYTLNEAAIELAKDRCMWFGHEWRIIETFRAPTGIVCSRCGASHAIAHAKE